MNAGNAALDPNARRDRKQDHSMEAQQRLQQRSVSIAQEAFIAALRMGEGD